MMERIVRVGGGANPCNSRKRQHVDAPSHSETMILKAISTPELIKKVIELGRKKFASERPDSSAGSVVKDDFHILFYPSFLSCPMLLLELDEENKIEVKRAVWAKAFLEFDMEIIARILSEDIFSFDEFLKRDQEGDIDNLSKVKRDVIAKCSKWMMRKDQNPWSYTPDTIVGPLTPEEENAMQAAFLTFTVNATHENDRNAIEEDFSHLDTNQLIEDLGDLGFPVMSDSEINDYSRDLDEHETQHILISYQGNESQNVKTESQKKKELEKIEYDRIYVHYLRLIFEDPKSSKENCAVQAVKDLTQWIIPDNLDTFLDAVQIAPGRWKQARKKMKRKDVVGCAERLFRKYWDLDFRPPRDELTKFEDMCPVKRLAIIRGVAFLRAFCNTDVDFDPNIPAHNLFLTEEEIMDISQNLTQRAQEYTRKDDVVTENDFVSDQNGNDGMNEWSQDEILNNHINCPGGIGMNTVHSVANGIGEIGQPLLTPFVNPGSEGVVTNLPTTTTIFITDANTGHYKAVQVPMISIDNNGVSVLVPVLDKATITDAGTHATVCNGGPSPVATDNDCSNSSSESVQSNCSSIETVPLEVVDIKGIQIPKTVCNEAFKEFKIDDAQKSLIASAKTLFKEIVKNINICDMGVIKREGFTSNSLDQGRTEAIYEILGKIKSIKKNGTESFDFIEEIEPEKLTEIERSCIRHEVFVQYRSNLSAKRKLTAMANQIVEIKNSRQSELNSSNRLEFKTHRNRNAPWELEVIDGRKSEFFCLDNATLNFYPKPIKPTTIH